MGKILTVTLDDQMDRGLLPERQGVARELGQCSAIMVGGTRYRYGRSKKRYSRKARWQKPCPLPATRLINGMPFCDFHRDS